MSETVEGPDRPDEQDAAREIVQRSPNGHYMPGQSGNPTGQKNGYASKVRRELQSILDEKATEKETRTKLNILLRSVFARAVNGDMMAARIILDRVLPVTVQADVSMSGMAPTQVLGVFEVMAAEYARDGRLPPVEKPE